MVLTTQSTTLLLQYLSTVRAGHAAFPDYIGKMQAIDEAYARYKSTYDPATGTVAGQGIDAATTPVGAFNLPSITPPVVVSQVDSMVAYLADVFLSGYPMFPVVSSPKSAALAEQLEVLLSDHANMGGYARQFLLFFRDGIKYNFSAVEVEWASISQYSLTDEVLNPGTLSLKTAASYYNKVKRIDPYQIFCDPSVQIGDISADGDYAGYTEILSKTRLQRLMQRLEVEGQLINKAEVFKSSKDALPLIARTNHYRMHPQVSNYVTARKPTAERMLDLYFAEGVSNPSDSSKGKTRDLSLIHI